MKHYKVLGVSPDASQEEIRSSYERLVKELHPDHSTKPNAAQQFMRIREAYEVLSDPERRRKYNELGHTGLGQTDWNERSSSNHSQHSNDKSSPTGETRGWQASTRDTEQAEYIWNQNTDRMGTPRSPAHTGDAGLVRRLIAYSLVTVPILMMSITILILLVYQISTSVPIRTLTGIPMGIWIIGIMATSLGLVLVAEEILNEDRRLTQRIADDSIV